MMVLLSCSCDGGPVSFDTQSRCRAHSASRRSRSQRQTATPKSPAADAPIANASKSQAFERLLTLGERYDSVQVLQVVRFLSRTFNGEAFPFELFERLAVDADVSDDVLLCLDALRWATKRPFTSSCRTTSAGCYV